MTTQLNKIFNVEYGNKFDLNKMKRLTTWNDDAVNFISRSSKDNGISAIVKKIDDVEPYPRGLISVALGGAILSSFVQPRRFYTAQNIMVLTPLEPMTEQIKHFYCLCIKTNAYKYSAFGREANRTLHELIVPERNEIPGWVSTFSPEQYTQNLLRIFSHNGFEHKTTDNPTMVSLDTIFNVENGILLQSDKRYKMKMDGNYVPYIRPSYRQDTGISGFVNMAEIEPKHIYPKQTLYVSTNGQGSHTFAYVSISDFVPNSDVSILLPLRNMSLSEKLYYAYCISKNRYKFSYGRKPKGTRLKSILLPDAPPPFVEDSVIDRIITTWA